jgi:hypothetical protein
MGKCWNCRKVVSVIKDRPYHRNQSYHYEKSGFNYVCPIGVTQYKCTSGEDYVEIPRVNELHLLMGKYIIRGT